MSLVTHRLRDLRPHGDLHIVVAECACGWVSAPCRRDPAAAAFRGHLYRAWRRSARAA